LNLDTVHSLCCSFEFIIRFSLMTLLQKGVDKKGQN
jgi:hypothetical protein